MLRCIIDAKIDLHQHGFVPGKNLGTCIKDLYAL